jgi:hypothetical protein
VVEDAGRKVESAAGSIARVAALIGEITDASHQQTVGLDQVDAALSEIDQATRRNAALVEQSAAAARMLSDRAVELSAVAVGYFGAENCLVGVSPGPEATVNSRAGPDAVCASRAVAGLAARMRTMDFERADSTGRAADPALERAGSRCARTPRPGPSGRVRTCGHAESGLQRPGVAAHDRRRAHRRVDAHAAARGPDASGCRTAQDTEQVLEIGAGSGYMAALLAQRSRQVGASSGWPSWRSSRRTICVAPASATSRSSADRRRSADPGEGQSNVIVLSGSVPCWRMLGLSGSTSAAGS